MSSIVSYLNRFHGPEAFTRWLGDAALLSLDSVPEYSRPDTIAQQLGFDYTERWERAVLEGTDNRGRWFAHSSADDVVHSVEGYEHLVRLGTGYQYVELAWPELGDYTITFDTDPLNLDITGVDDSSSAISIDLLKPMTDLIQESSGDPLSVGETTLDFSGEKIEARLILLHMDGYDMVDSVSISNYDGLLLLRRK
jgi:hypothetical protein